MNKTHPLVVLKFCPKCGSDKFLSSNELSLKCKNCGFHFFINSAAAVAVLIFNDDGQLLLTTRGVDPHKGKLDLPGGFVDAGETAEQSVKRELQEELGIDKITEIKYLFSEPNEYIFSNFTVFTLDMAFKVILPNYDNLIAKDDVSNFKFYAKNEFNLSEIPLTSIRKIIKKYIHEFN